MHYLSRPATNQEQIQNGVRHLLLGWTPRPRNGKVAKLPEPIRERINNMIEDGLSYRAILDRLRESTPPLPYPLSEMNLSNWARGGYPEWRAKQRLEKVRAQLAENKEVPAAIRAEWKLPEAVKA